MANVVSYEWYQNLVEDCKNILTEAVFTSRWALIECYHQLGERIRKESEKTPITKFTARLSVDLKQSERTLWRAVQFYDTYQDLNNLPEGKNISWNKILTKYLAKEQSEEVEEDKQEAKITCPKCGFSWSKKAKIIQ